MEHKKAASSKTRSAAKTEHSATKTASTPKAAEHKAPVEHEATAEHKPVRRHTPTRAPSNAAPSLNYTAIPNEPPEIAALSQTQQAQIFDMTYSADPTTDSQAVQDARVQAAVEPLGTSAAIEPIITEDGVVTPYNG